MARASGVVLAVPASVASPILATVSSKLSAELGNIEFAQGLVDKFLKREENQLIDRIFIDKNTERLFMVLKHFPGKGMNAQRIIENIFSVNKPVYYMAREKIIFKLTRGKESIIKSLDLRS